MSSFTLETSTLLNDSLLFVDPFSAITVALSLTSHDLVLLTPFNQFKFRHLLPPQMTLTIDFSQDIVTSSTRFALNSASKTLKRIYKDCVRLNTSSHERHWCKCLSNFESGDMLQIHARRSDCGHQLLGYQGWCWVTGCCGQQQPNSTTAAAAGWWLDTGACSQLCSDCGLGRSDRREGTDRSLAPGDALHYRHWHPALFPRLSLVTPSVSWPLIGWGMTAAVSANRCNTL